MASSTRLDYTVGVDIQAPGVAWGLWPIEERAYEPDVGWIPLSPFVRKQPHKQRTKRLEELHGISRFPIFQGASAVYLEEPFGANRNAQSVLNQLIGAFVGSMAWNNIPIIMINTSTWKKEIFDTKEKRGKPEIMAKARMLLPGRDLTQDQADAICIARAGAVRWVSTGLDTWIAV